MAHVVVLVGYRGQWTMMDDNTMSYVGGKQKMLKIHLDMTYDGLVELLSDLLGNARVEVEEPDVMNVPSLDLLETIEDWANGEKRKHGDEMDDILVDEPECEETMHVNISADYVECPPHPTLTTLHMIPEPINEVPLVDDIETEARRDPM
ncbi:hypothetical protein Patl1_16020 [Pistacia atlantica]|uniref:Uncharacterized protein n=1 Tax=Pistacia atlantica TaxID=434234 RepID=A0ACC1B833_9ROSI|nr:hypothetical protein Patl1_16020 [Pistacia atlantica]